MMPRCKYNHAGFTLLELMIVVTVVAIMASIAYPSYMAHIQSARREEGKKALLEAAQKMESFYALNQTYVGSADANGRSTIFSSNVPSDTSINYVLSVSATKTSYTITATRSSSSAQRTDPCGDLIIKRDGTKTVANATYSSSQCW